MRKRDIKLAPLAYMHYMEKGLLDPNPHKKQNIQCINGDVKLPLTCVPHKEERSNSTICVIHAT